MKVIDGLFKFIANTMTDVSKTTKGVLPVKFGGSGIEDLNQMAAGGWNGMALDAVNVPSGTATKIGSFELPKGAYLIIIYGDFARNDTGYRGLYLAKEGDTAVRYNINRDYRAACAGMLGTLRVVSLMKVTGEKLDILAYQNSGTALAFNARYSVIKLGGV